MAAAECLFCPRITHSGPQFLNATNRRFPLLSRAKATSAPCGAGSLAIVKAQVWPCSDPLEMHEFQA